MSETGSVAHHGRRAAGRRGAFLAAQLTAMHATALQLVDAHSRLAATLPPAPGSLAERLQDWRLAHAAPADRLPELARRAITENVARTREIIELQDELHVDVRLDPGPHRGHYAGAGRGGYSRSRCCPPN